MQGCWSSTDGSLAAGPRRHSSISCDRRSRHRERCRDVARQPPRRAPRGARSSKCASPVAFARIRPERASARPGQALAVDSTVWRSTFHAIVFGAGDFHTPHGRPPAAAAACAGDRLRSANSRRRIDHLQSSSAGRAALRRIVSDTCGRGSRVTAGPSSTRTCRSHLRSGTCGRRWRDHPWPSRRHRHLLLDWQCMTRLRQRGIAFVTITHAAGISSTGDPALDRRLPFDEAYRIPRRDGVCHRVRRERTADGLSRSGRRSCAHSSMPRPVTASCTRVTPSRTSMSVPREPAPNRRCHSVRHSRTREQPLPSDVRFWTTRRWPGATRRSRRWATGRTSSATPCLIEKSRLPVRDAAGSCNRPEACVTAAA